MSLSTDDRKQLARWIRSPTAPQRLVKRSRIVLMAAEGWLQREIAEAVKVSRPTVRLWIDRWNTGGVHQLSRDAAGRGRKSTAATATFRAKLLAALNADPDLGRTSIRQLARTYNLSPSTVWRALRGLGR